MTRKISKGNNFLLHIVKKGEKKIVAERLRFRIKIFLKTKLFRGTKDRSLRLYAN